MILIIGPTGNNGAPALNKLLELGYPVRALVRSPQSAAKLPMAEKLEVVMGDLDDIQSLVDVLQGVHKVFFTTAYSPKMIQQTKNLVVAALANNIKHLVLLSGVGANIDAPDTTLRWLGEMEQAVKNTDIAYTILQGSSFMQNFFASAQSICKENKIYASAKTTKLTLVDTRDIGKVAATVITSENHKNCTYTITGYEILTYQEITDVFTKILQHKIDYVYIPISKMKENMLAAGMPINVVSPLVELWQNLEEIPFTFPLSNTVKELTGDEPNTLRQFVMDYKNLFS